jgi:hypothetical protein
MVLSVVSNAS